MYFISMRRTAMFVFTSSLLLVAACGPDEQRSAAPEPQAPPVVREHANIPDDQVIMTCVALGWPDDSFSANAVRSHRRPIDQVATFVGFD